MAGLLRSGPTTTYQSVIVTLGEARTEYGETVYLVVDSGNWRSTNEPIALMTEPGVYPKWRIAISHIPVNMQQPVKYHYLIRNAHGVRESEPPEFRELDMSTIKDGKQWDAAFMKRSYNPPLPSAESPGSAITEPWGRRRELEQEAFQRYQEASRDYSTNLLRAAIEDEVFLTYLAEKLKSLPASQPERDFIKIEAADAAAAAAAATCAPSEGWGMSMSGIFGLGSGTTAATAQAEPPWKTAVEALASELQTLQESVGALSSTSEALLRKCEGLCQKTEVESLVRSVKVLDGQFEQLQKKVVDSLPALSAKMGPLEVRVGALEEAAGRLQQEQLPELHRALGIAREGVEDVRDMNRVLRMKFTEWTQECKREAAGKEPDHLRNVVASEPAQQVAEDGVQGEAVEGPPSASAPAADLVRQPPTPSPPASSPPAPAPAPGPGRTAAVPAEPLAANPVPSPAVDAGSCRDTFPAASCPAAEERNAAAPVPGPAPMRPVRVPPLAASPPDGLSSPQGGGSPLAGQDGSGSLQGGGSPFPGQDSYDDAVVREVLIASADALPLAPGQWQNEGDRVEITPRTEKHAVRRAECPEVDEAALEPPPPDDGPLPEPRMKEPPHPEDPVARRITLWAESVLLGTGKKSPQVRLQTFRALCKRLHPDKPGGNHEAQLYLNAWKDKYGAKYFEGAITRAPPTLSWPGVDAP